MHDRTAAIQALLDASAAVRKACAVDEWREVERALERVISNLDDGSAARLLRFSDASSWLPVGDPDAALAALMRELAAMVLRERDAGDEQRTRADALDVRWESLAARLQGSRNPREALRAFGLVSAKTASARVRLLELARFYAGTLDGSVVPPRAVETVLSSVR